MAAVAATNPTVDELEKKEEELFRTGPLSVLTTSVKSNSQVGELARQSCISMSFLAHTKYHSALG